jgi:Fe-S oxidoreductase
VGSAGSPEPFRAFLPALPGWVDPLVYVAFAAMLAFLIWDATLRLRRWGVGWREFLSTVWRRVRRRPAAVAGVLARDGVGQQRVRRQRYAGVMHVLIFWAFLVLTLGTLLIGLEQDVTARIAGLRLLRGDFYLGYEVALDTAGLLLVAGVLLAAWRRFVRRPESLPPRRGIGLVYALLLYVALSGFLLEALRLLVRPVPWAHYSYVGWSLGRLLAPLAGPHPLALYWAVWGAHVAVAFAGMAIVLRTALDHAVLLPINMALQAGRDPGRLAFPFNLATLTDEAALESLSAGFGDVANLAWPHRLSLDVCVECGRCDLVCPALAAGRPLSPRGLVRALSQEIRTAGEAIPQGGGNLFARGVIEEATVWSCVTCGACARECPASIDHPGTVVDLRRFLVAEGQLDQRQLALAENLERHGNPLGLPSFQRAEWLEDLAVPSLRDRPGAEYLYWIGCMAAYDPRVRSVAEAMVRILQHADVNFAVLGAEERCCGESARKLGDEAGFQVRAMETIALLQEHGVSKILTHCPHCLTTLAKDYPELGGSFEVVHHSELLARLIREKRVPTPVASQDGPVTYHDPCQLGRLGGQYEAPRQVVKSAADDRFVEMQRSRDRGFCCGAGGSGYWWVVPERQKISHLRLEHAGAVGAKTVATACPFCLAMLEDASRATEGPRVADLAELVAAGLPRPAA